MPAAHSRGCIRGGTASRARGRRPRQSSRRQHGGSAPTPPCMHTHLIFDLALLVRPAPQRSPSPPSFLSCGCRLLIPAMKASHCPALVQLFCPWFLATAPFAAPNCFLATSTTMLRAGLQQTTAALATVGVDAKLQQNHAAASTRSLLPWHEHVRLFAHMLCSPRLLFNILSPLALGFPCDLRLRAVKALAPVLTSHSQGSGWRAELRRAALPLCCMAASPGMAALKSFSCRRPSVETL